MCSPISGNRAFVDQRQQFINATDDPNLKRHYQAEIDLVNSWGNQAPKPPAAKNASHVPPLDNADILDSDSPGLPGLQTSSRLSANNDYPADGTGGWGEMDLKIGKDKITELLPQIKEAAAQNGIDWKELAAVILQEGRGLTADQLHTSAGVAQMGAPEIDALRKGQDPANIGNKIKAHPELTSGDPLSNHNQIFGAAAYLGVLKEKAGGDWEKTLVMYNVGPNSGGVYTGKTGDKDYMQKHADALSILDSFNLG